MNTALFFDDQRLFTRSGFERKYGEPEFMEDAVYCDPRNSASGGMPSVWRAPDGKYHLFYQAFTPEHETVPFAAVSDDAVHWTPRDSAAACLAAPRFANQLLDTFDTELACVYRDEHDVPERRLKALTARYLHEELSVADEVYASPDGYRWTKTDIVWSDRHVEPGAGCVWSEAVGRHIVVARAAWGSRRLCVYETPDWKTFTPSRVAVQVDSLDEPDLETYGMPVFRYKGWYIGLLWLYHTIPENHLHYMNGTMNAQLCYSVNGVHWQRCLRTPFIGNDRPETRGMVFPAAVTPRGDGLIITASATPNEHGYFKEGGGCIVSYRLRRDGFVRLAAAGDAALATREVALLGGEVTWNLSARRATVAVFDGRGDGECHPIEGFGHGDCVPFSGDDTAWVPTYAGGRTLASLAGRAVSFELRLTDGSVYAYEGDFVPMMNTQTARYRKFGVLPEPEIV